jgi:hypothetical protein
LAAIQIAKIIAQVLGGEFGGAEGGLQRSLIGCSHFYSENDCLAPELIACSINYRFRARNSIRKFHAVSNWVTVVSLQAIVSRAGDKFRQLTRQALLETKNSAAEM